MSTAKTAIHAAIKAVLQKFYFWYTNAQIANAINVYLGGKGLDLTNAHSLSNQRAGLGLLKEDIEVPSGEAPPLVVDAIMDEAIANFKNKEGTRWTSEQESIVRGGFEKLRKLTLPDEIEEEKANILRKLATQGRETTWRVVDNFARKRGLRMSIEPREQRENDAIAIAEVFNFAELGEYPKKRDVILEKIREKIPRYEHLESIANRITLLTREGLVSPPEWWEHATSTEKVEPVLEKSAEFKLKDWLINNLERIIARYPEINTITGLVAFLKTNPPQEKVSEIDDGSLELTVEAALDVLYWPKPVRQVATAAIKASWMPEKLFSEMRPFWTDRLPPLWVVSEKIRSIKGRTEIPRGADAKILRGVNVLPIAEATGEIPEKYRYRNPFNILPGVTADTVSVSIVSAMQIGAPYDPIIESNLTRCAWATSRKYQGGVGAKIVVGPIFNLILKRAGKNKVLESLLSRGREVPLEAFMEYYRQAVKQRRASDTLAPIYMTTSERTKELSQGLKKVTVTPKGTPEFNGPVYIVLSIEDTKIIARLADAHLAILKSADLEEAKNLKGIRAKSLEVLRVQHERLMEEGVVDAGKIRDLDQRIQEADRLLQEAVDLDVRTRVTNYEDTRVVEVYDQAMRFYIGLVEDSIPNSKVIGVNNACFTLGNHKQVFEIYAGQSASDRTYEKIVRRMGSVHRSGQLPDVTFVCNSGHTNYHETSVETYADVMRGTKMFVKVPCLIDGAAVRMVGEEYPEMNIPGLRAALTNKFLGGMVILKVVRRSGIDVRHLPESVIKNYGRRSVQRKAPKYFWMIDPTDPHIEGNRAVVWTPEGAPNFILEMFFELTQRWGMSDSGACLFFAMINVLDDWLQGNHFGTHLAIERGEITRPEIFARYRRAIQERSRVSKKKGQSITQEIEMMLITQILERRSHNLTGQYMSLFDSLLEPHFDVIRGALIKAHKIGVTINTVGQIIRKDIDTCDIGFINCLSGNHTDSSTGSMWREGPAIARSLRLAASRDPLIKKHGIDYKKYICAPIHGKQESEGYGQIVMPGGVKYGVHLASCPLGRDSWVEVTRKWIDAWFTQANPSGILHDLPVIHLAGNYHIPDAAQIQGNHFFAVEPSQTQTDSFASTAKGLRETVPGIGIVGLPFDGPDKHEIRHRIITLDDLQDAANHPDRRFPFEDFFEYAAQEMT